MNYKSTKYSKGLNNHNALVMGKSGEQKMIDEIYVRMGTWFAWTVKKKNGSGWLVNKGKCACVEEAFIITITLCSMK